MKTPASGLRFDRLPKDYAGLCRLHMPRPIHDRVELENVTEVADAMAGHVLTTDQEDYFDLLCRLIETYEHEHGEVVPSKADGLAVLRHLLQEQGMSAAELSRLLGVHRTLGGMILRGERKLTLAHVGKLCAHFGVSADLFVQAA